MCSVTMCNADNLTIAVPEESAKGHDYHSNSLQKMIGEIFSLEVRNVSYPVHLANR